MLKYDKNVIGGKRWACNWSNLVTSYLVVSVHMKLPKFPTTAISWQIFRFLMLKCFLCKAHGLNQQQKQSHNTAGVPRRVSTAGSDVRILVVNVRMKLPKFLITTISWRIFRFLMLKCFLCKVHGLNQQRKQSHNTAGVPRRVSTAGSAVLILVVNVHMKLPKFPITAISWRIFRFLMLKCFLCKVHGLNQQRKQSHNTAGVPRRASTAGSDVLILVVNETAKIPNYCNVMANISIFDVKMFSMQGSWLELVAKVVS